MKSIVFETIKSYSNVFVSMNDYFINKGVKLFYNNSIYGKVLAKFKKSNRISQLMPKIFDYSITAMPMYYAGLGKKNLLWVHDALTFEEYYIYGEKRDDLNEMNKKLFKWAQDAKYLITPSEYSKLKLLDIFKCEDEKIQVIPYQLNSLEYSKISSNKAILDEIREKYNFYHYKANYIFIGSPHYRKNLKTVVESFDLIKKEIPDSRLIVISFPRYDIPITRIVYDEIARRNDVLLINNVQKEELIGLIRLSTLLINPTLEEGFGLPNIEAQMCGIPVVSSNISCIPEILMDTALLVDPRDSIKIANACLQVTLDTSVRESLITKGFQNINRFNNPELVYSRMLEMCD